MGIFPTSSKYPRGSKENLREVIAVPGQYSWINLGNYSKFLLDQKMVGMSSMCTKVEYKLHEDGNTVSMSCVVPGDRHIPLIGSEFRLNEVLDDSFQGIPEWFPLPGRKMFVFSDRNVMKKPKWRYGAESSGVVVESHAELSDDKKVMLVKAKTADNEVVEQSYRI